jgi:hypothetical protein
LARECLFDNPCKVDEIKPTGLTAKAGFI